jgi:uncharacterized protein (TIRG00374 family)
MIINSLQFGVKQIINSFRNGALSDKRIQFLIKSIIFLGLIHYILTNINFNELYNQLIQADILLISISLLLSTLNIYIQFVKWKLITTVMLNDNDNYKVIISLLEGFAASIFTPARLGEYVGRAVVYSDKPFLQVTIATIVDKLFSLFIIISFGSIASLLFIHFYYQVSFFLTISLFIVLFSLIYIFIYLISTDDFIDNFLLSKIKRNKFLYKYYEKISILNRLDKNFKAKMFLLSFVFYMCFIIQYVILIMAFSLHYNFIYYFWAGNLVIFAKTLIPPVTLGDFGIRESASIYFIKYFGEKAIVGFNASVFLFIINILLPSIIGIILNKRVKKVDN